MGKVVDTLRAAAVAGQSRKEPLFGSATETDRL